MLVRTCAHESRLFGNRRLMSAKGFAGSNPLRFLKQFEDYGLKGKLAVLPIGDIGDTIGGRSKPRAQKSFLLASIDAVR